MDSEYFPDNSLIDEWFYDDSVSELEALGKQYKITDYGVLSDGKIYTKELQNLIDTVYENGGGVIVVPKGTYITGALFFKNGVNLYIEENGVIKGSDDISDYPLMITRIEGETCKYFPALINADNTKGFTMCGKGTVDGNGFKSWKAFWIRRKWNPKCTNKDEQRPRLVYVSNSENVTISGLNLKNSHFWTNHFYKCKYVKFFNCNVYSPASPVGAPSTDAVDIDVCSFVHIKDCRFEVNDDAIALKGGKGPLADKDRNNGENERIIIENCEYGFCHSCLTCGSESIHNKNVILRNVKVNDCSYNLLQFKMRPDTPQCYEYITVENAVGTVKNFININPWKQFFNPQDAESVPISTTKHITVKNCDIKCKKYFNVLPNESQYLLSDFTFENLDIEAEENGYTDDAVKNMNTKNVTVRISDF